jgi:hypothetical protein
LTSTNNNPIQVFMGSATALNVADDLSETYIHDEPVLVLTSSQDCLLSIPNQADYRVGTAGLGPHAGGGVISFSFSGRKSTWIMMLCCNINDKATQQVPSLLASSIRFVL